MKIYGLQGAMTGKIGNTVMVIRNGVQIARQYQPKVADSKSIPQVQQRAKFKLASQLAAVFAPIIAIPREGLASKRAMFVKDNFDSITYANDEASVVLTNVKITKSVVALPSVSVTRGTGVVDVALGASTSLDVSRVVYAMFTKQNDGTLRYSGSQVVSTPGTNNTYAGQFNLNTTADEVVVYAYGVRDNNEAARAKFGEMTAPTAEDIAKLIVTRQLTESDVTLTETRSAASVPPGN